MENEAEKNKDKMPKLCEHQEKEKKMVKRNVIV
jgi:hypothetical protein